MKRTAVRFAVLLFFVTILPMAAQTGAWTAVGSDGTLDETSLGIYATNPNALLHLGGATGTVVARYNVTNTFGGGLTDTPPWNTLEMSYFDNSPNSSVSAILYRVNRCSSTIVALCSVTSTDAAAPTCASCNFTAGINFNAFNYVVEVRVSRSVPNVTPQLFSVRVF